MNRRSEIGCRFINSMTRTAWLEEKKGEEVACGLASRPRSKRKQGSAGEGSESGGRARLMLRKDEASEKYV